MGQNLSIVWSASIEIDLVRKGEQSRQSPYELFLPPIYVSTTNNRERDERFYCPSNDIKWFTNCFRSKQIEIKYRFDSGEFVSWVTFTRLEEFEDDQKGLRKRQGLQSALEGLENLSESVRRFPWLHRSIKLVATKLMNIPYSEKNDIYNDKDSQSGGKQSIDNQKKGDDDEALA